LKLFRRRIEGYLRRKAKILVEQQADLTKALLRVWTTTTKAFFLESRNLQILCRIKGVSFESNQSRIFAPETSLN
jgi:hypothetical protein